MKEKVKNGFLKSFKNLNLKEKEVKYMRKSGVLLVLTIVATFIIGVAAAHAVPIQLFTDEITKLKFVNYENWHDVGNAGVDVYGNPASTPGDGKINAGDSFEGIFNVESITNVTGSRDLSAQLLNRELTGHFQLSVIAGMIPIGGPGHLDFALLSGDFVNYFVGTGATKNWDPAQPNAIARATDGAPWASIQPTEFYEGINDTIISPVAFSLNRNWADFTVEPTGYPIQPMLWSNVLNEIPAHLYLNNLHGGHVTDTYFTSHLSTSNLSNWGFRSEDPMYVNAVPEPATMLLFGTGLVGLAGAARRRISRNKK